MNPYKESWQQDVGFAPKRSKNHLAKRFNFLPSRMFHGHSDRTKWERIGRPLFVETPYRVFEGVSNFFTLYGKAKKMTKVLYQLGHEENMKRIFHPLFGWK